MLCYNLILLLCLLYHALCFTGSNNGNRIFASRKGFTQFSMIFDFIKKRSEEGIIQVQNIAAKTLEGKFNEALTESASYVRRRQEIDKANLQKVFEEENVDLEERLAKLEEVLLQADIGSITTKTILSDLRDYARDEKLELDDIAPVMRRRLIEALTASGKKRGLNMASSSNSTTIILVIGANGMGKTTTIGKISARLRNEANATVLLAACDTYRAAAVEQLSEWARRANVSIERATAEESGKSPLPVLRRSLQRAKDENVDFLIVDTSGRLSNNYELTQELVDMKEAIAEYDKEAPHEILLVVDGSLGRNAVDQALTWKKYVGISSIAITKMDGTARGGFVVSVVKDLKIPVKFIGVGEKLDDLRDFDAESFVDALLGNTQDKIAQLKSRADAIIMKSEAVRKSEKNNNKQTKQNLPPSLQMSSTMEGSSSGTSSSNESTKQKSKKDKSKRR